MKRRGRIVSSNETPKAKKRKTRANSADVKSKTQNTHADLSESDPKLEIPVQPKEPKSRPSTRGTLKFGSRKESKSKLKAEPVSKTKSVSKKGKSTAGSETPKAGTATSAPKKKKKATKPPLEASGRGKTGQVPPKPKGKEHMVEPEIISPQPNQPKSPVKSEAANAETPKVEGTVPPESLAALGLSKEMWEYLEASQQNLPRFLFRAFGTYSGGDPRLNTADGITPRGFLKGKKPTNIYEIPRLGEMVQRHVTGGTIATDFSSWAPCISFALANASQHAYVGIIDVTLLAPHVKIYHVTDLVDAGICADNYPYEYLAYGPINGPAFHCVAYSAAIGRDYSTLAGHAYKNSNFDKSIYTDLDKRVSTAKKLAALFRPDRDKRPDIIVALTAAFSSLAYSGYDKSRALNQGLYDQLIIHLSDELEDVKLPPIGSKHPGLVNHKMYTYKFPQLQQLVVLLGAIENRIKSKCRAEHPPDSRSSRQRISL
ncbi:hypothetical protein F5Y13DRAFT_191638 [Hypoxylon sp. FL1857]|nr:hypothetical protein F5Y13DRAFT_191638 [Hypoxylon sp. FL1857]